MQVRVTLRFLAICLFGGFVTVLIEDVSIAATTHTMLVAKRSARSRDMKLARIREALHRNLDGKGNGFIVSWRFDSKSFTLTVDRLRYEQNMLYAATITARSIFDLEGVALPRRLIIRDRHGEVLGDGLFANVPRIVQ